MNLLQPTPPWVQQTAKSLEICLPTLPATLQLYRLDGKRMNDLDACYDEFSRVFHLPQYFGRNLNALNECLTDVDVLSGEAFLCWIANGEKLLSKEPADCLAGLLDCLRSVGEQWSLPVQRGEAWDHPAIPFHSIIQVNGPASALLQQLPQT